MIAYLGGQIADALDEAEPFAAQKLPSSRARRGNERQRAATSGILRIAGSRLVIQISCASLSSYASRFAGRCAEAELMQQSGDHG
jgi:hypothetical protein